MNILKAFENNDMQMNVTIKGSHENPLFRASDIGEILEITNIRQSIHDFDHTEKHGVSITDAIGRAQETTFLTEKGLYKILFRSRKPIAKQFTDWVCEVIQEIRLNGKYDLEKQLKNKDDTIKYKDEIIEYKQFQKESNIMENFNHKPIVYLTIVDKNLVKFGFTNDVKQRIYDHRKQFGPKFSIDYVFESIYNRAIERKIKDHEILSSKIISKIFSDRTQTELIKLNDKFTIEDLWKIVNEIKKQVENENNKDFVITQQKLEIAELKLELISLQEKYDKISEDFYDKKRSVNKTNNKPIKMISFECSSCGYTTGRKDHMKRHIDTLTLGCTDATILEIDAFHKCKYCNKLHESSRGLQDHERKCKICVN
jgi:prophage antirepressor-like protein